MGKRRQIEIVKVYNNREQTDRPIEFLRTPILYLELLENKEKIKATEVNNEYKPSDTVNTMDFLKDMNRRNSKTKNSSSSSKDIFNYNDVKVSGEVDTRSKLSKLQMLNKSLDNLDLLDDRSVGSNKTGGSSRSKDIDYLEEFKFDNNNNNNRRNKFKSENSSPISNRSYIEERGLDKKHNSDKNRLDISDEFKFSREDKSIDDSRSDDFNRVNSVHRVKAKKLQYSNESNQRDFEDFDDKSNKGLFKSGMFENSEDNIVDRGESNNLRDDESDKLSVKLKELLNDNNLESSQRISDKSKDIQDINRDVQDIKRDVPDRFNINNRDSNKLEDRFNDNVKSRVPDRFTKVNVPTLNELHNTGKISSSKILPKVDNQAFMNDDEEDMKREYLFKFSILKKSYPLGDVPEYTVHSDLNQMKRSYDNTVRRLTLDSTVETYKSYLLGGFMFTEYVFGKWFGFEMDGFTQQQMLNMNQYERLLIELGEKSYVPQSKQWPVEMRLLGMILMNAAFFVGTKIIMKKAGSGNLSSILSTFGKPNVQKKSRKMKGPNTKMS